MKIVDTIVVIIASCFALFLIAILISILIGHIYDKHTYRKLRIIEDPCGTYTVEIYDRRVDYNGNYSYGWVEIDGLTFETFEQAMNSLKEYREKNPRKEKKYKPKEVYREK